MLSEPCQMQIIIPFLTEEKGWKRQMHTIHFISNKK